MQILNIYARRIYEKDGEKKVQFYKAGILKETDSGRKFIRMFNQPQHDFIVLEGNENNQSGEKNERENHVEQS
jgi:hypothetical protein